MNLDKLFEWIIVIVLTCAATGNLDNLTAWIHRSQAKLIHESRASSWGSPSIFSRSHNHHRKVGNL